VLQGQRIANFAILDESISGETRQRFTLAQGATGRVGGHVIAFWSVMTFWRQIHWWLQHFVQRIQLHFGHTSYVTPTAVFFVGCQDKLQAIITKSSAACR
jgi:hypothetical protein